jgi:small subunit ribosomal protein S16
MDARSPRDGRVIEELGHYDPMIGETDARAMLNGERIDYWLSVGAQPSEKVKVLIRKYGSQGTHLEQQRTALEKLKVRPQAPPPQAVALAPKGTARAAESAAEQEVAVSHEAPSE